MPLGMEVGLSPGDFVLDGDPAPLKGHRPQFLSNVRCGQTARWMKTPLGTEVDIGAGHIVLDGFTALRERRTAPPLLGPCLLWPRSPISPAAELLFFLHYTPLYGHPFTVAGGGAILALQSWQEHLRGESRHV